MVLPLLGLLAVGALEANRGGIENRRNRARGQNRVKSYERGLLNDPMRRDGAGDTKFNESGAIFYGGGDLSANNFLSQRYDQDLQTQAENAQMARQKVASGPGYANAALNREKWEHEKKRVEDLALNQKLADEWTVENFADPRTKDLANNPFATPQITRELARVAQENYLNAVPLSDSETAMVSDYGPNWRNLSNEDQSDVLGLEDSIVRLKEAQNFFDGTNALERGPGGGITKEAAEQASNYMLDSLTYLQKTTGAGAMQEAEIELFRELAGNPSSWGNLTDSVKGRMSSIIKRAEGDLNTMNKVFDLTGSAGRTNITYTDTATGRPLEEVSNEAVGNALDKAREATARLDATAPTISQRQAQGAVDNGGGAITMTAKQMREAMKRIGIE